MPKPGAIQTGEPPMNPFVEQVRALSRRGLLRGASAATVLAALAPATSRSAWAQPVFGSYPFSLGVASGDPWPDSVVLWTRIAPDPLHGGGMPMRPVQVGWEVAEDRSFRRVVQKGETLARPELGHSVHVEAGGLLPARPYFYRFRVGSELSPIGATRTAPAPDAMPASLRFANLGCQRWEQGLFTAFDHAAKEELDFVFHYGDYIYEYRNRNNASAMVRPVTGDEIYTVVDYRNRYALYKSDPALAAAHAAHPFLMSYDDHEVDNNWAGLSSEEDDDERFPAAVPPEYFALRKQMAFQAWYESMPVRKAQLPRGPSMPSWRRLAYGQLAQIDVLDTRQFRDDQPCRDISGPPCAAVGNPSAQMLGAEQERWYFDGLAASRARWNVMAQQVMVMARDLATAEVPTISMDKWDALPAARDRLLRHVADAKVPGFVVLTGDVHNAWAGELKLDFGSDRSPVLGTEFVATSISSGGDGFDETDATRRTLARNPHMRFFNNRRGYSVHELTPERMTVEFKTVEFVTRPGAPLHTQARFVVEAGRPGIASA